MLLKTHIQIAQHIYDGEKQLSYKKMKSLKYSGNTTVKEKLTRIRIYDFSPIYSPRFFLAVQ